ncbi:MAG: hypothetical protein AB1766_04935 [Pseudomonadota bacterium]
MNSEELQKTRDVLFRRLHPDPEQATLAATLVLEYDGVLEAEAFGPLHLRVRYDLSRICLSMLIDILQMAGFHIDNNLLERLRRALHFYSEDAQRASLNIACQNPLRRDTPSSPSIEVRSQSALHEKDPWRQYL